MAEEAVFIRIDFARCSEIFLAALGNLIERIDHADSALLEDAIRDANEAVKTALTDPEALAFLLDD